MHHSIGIREEILRVVSKKQLVIVAKQRVPIMAKVEFTVCFARVTFIDADQFSMTGIQGEKVPWCISTFKDNVVPTCMLKEIGHLQA